MQLWDGDADEPQEVAYIVVLLLRLNSTRVLSYQPRVTVTSCFLYKVIRDLFSIDYLCINPILRIGLIHK